MITNCCQSIGGNSEECVIDGVTKENKFYIMKLGTIKDLKDFTIEQIADLFNHKTNLEELKKLTTIIDTKEVLKTIKASFKLGGVIN
ncbi:MAG: hypothetical protein LN588_03225 [Rickettsia endosymbiont of Bryobia graminum]|nr:hypothetical protein [Rickettsia endosymbiont of Bryobia graminum]